MEIDKDSRDLTGIENNEVWLSREEVKATENISETTFKRRFRGYQYTHRYVASSNGGRGGKKVEVALSSLSPEGQRRYVEEMYTKDPSNVSKELVERIGFLPPALQLTASLSMAETGNGLPGQGQAGQGGPAWTEETAVSPADLRDPRAVRWAKIVREALEVPGGWKKRAWVEAVAVKHEVSWQAIYRMIREYNRKGFAAFRHRKPAQRGRAKVWSPEAMDFWVGLCLKKEHRKISKEELYRILAVESEKRDWNIGSYSSAIWWFNKRATPQLLALQRGGMRALDNTLPPILRDYSDLAPFEILVGDQHRFDFWVTDEDTGEVFRPEGYLWQDLRTRVIYGLAVDRKYDSQLMGLALRIGMRIFGAFESIYTDHGKPEESRYITSIMKDMRSLGLFARQTVEAPVDLDGVDPEEINPCVGAPGTHTKAIVRNAKAKMIESTNSKFEAILRNQFRVPGGVKKLGAVQEENEVDDQEIARLARAGKLLTFREFSLTLFKAADYYNSQKHHRGVLREWSRPPRPRAATPMDCLKMCCEEGWRPVHLNRETADLIFMARPDRPRTVDRGRIWFRGVAYEHGALVELNGKRVDLRYDPMDLGRILVFQGDTYLCTAEAAEYSSMKDKDLAADKQAKKAERRRHHSEEYHELTSRTPDVMAYSHVSKLDKAAAVIGREKRRRAEAENELSRVRSQEELEREVEALEKKKSEVRSQRAEKEKKLPVRPDYFLTEYDHYKWIVSYELSGGTLGPEDAAFKGGYEGRMDEGQREHWEVVRELGYRQ